MNKKALLITAVCVTVGAIVGSFAWKTITSNNPTFSFDKALVQASNDMNKGLPTMVDKETRLDATFAGPGTRFTYSNSLVNYAKDQIDLKSFREIMTPQIVANYKTHEDMKDFREHNVELHYQYKDKNGEYITDIVVSPRDF